MRGRMARWMAAGLAVTAGAMVTSTMAAETTLGLDVNSAYVWRGITLNDGLVAQPSVDVQMPAGFGVSVWGNMDLDSYNGKFDKGEFSEMDLTASYSFEKGPFEFSAGVNEYLYPHQTEEMENGGARALPGTREIFAGVTADLTHGFSAGVEGFYDIDEVEDFYAYVKVGYERDIVEEKLTASATASAGAAGKDWAAYYSGGTKGGLHEYELGIGLTYTPTEALEVGAKVAYVDSLDKDVLSEQDTNVYGGASVAFKF